MQGKLVAATTALALALVGSAAASAATVPGCAGSAPGGTWTSYGGGLDNARDQRAETTIGAANAGSLAPVWDLKTADGGTFQTTPVIADGCMFIGSSTGKVYARNAEVTGLGSSDGARITTEVQLVSLVAVVGQGQILIPERDDRV